MANPGGMDRAEAEVIHDSGRDACVKVLLVTFAFHDKATIRPALVRKILFKDVGLAEDDARKLL